MWMREACARAIGQPLSTLPPYAPRSVLLAVAPASLRPARTDTRPLPPARRGPPQHSASCTVDSCVLCWLETFLPHMAVAHCDETTPAHAIFSGYFQNQCVRRGTVCVARACLRALPAAWCTLCRPAAPLCVRVVCACARRQAAGCTRCTRATTLPRPALPTAIGTWPMTNGDGSIIVSYLLFLSSCPDLS